MFLFSGEEKLNRDINGGPKHETVRAPRFGIHEVNRDLTQFEPARGKSDAFVMKSSTSPRLRRMKKQKKRTRFEPFVTIL